MKIAEATGIEQNLYPVMKSITKSALKANVTLERIQWLYELFGEGKKRHTRGT